MIVEALMLPATGLAPQAEGIRARRAATSGKQLVYGIADQRCARAALVFGKSVQRTDLSIGNVDERSHGPMIYDDVIGYQLGSRHHRDTGSARIFLDLAPDRLD